MVTYELVNALQMHNQHAETFSIPDLSEIRALKVGDFVKLIFIQDGHSERMWVEIKEIKGNNYLGRLDNIPILVDIDLNEIVSFEEKHIINTIIIKRS